MKRPAVLLKDQVVYLLYRRPKAGNYCPYHRRRRHTLEQCVVFRRLFDEKLKDGEILLTAKSTKHHSKGMMTEERGHVMMVCQSTIGESL